MFEVLNIRRAGPGVELAPRADPSDGRFDIVSATAAQRPSLLRTLKARLKDKKGVSNMTTRRASRVQLAIHADCEMRIDDGTISVEADTQVEITMRAGELEFLLPGK